jgi:hypothetical protein
VSGADDPAGLGSYGHRCCGPVAAATAAARLASQHGDQVGQGGRAVFGGIVDHQQQGPVRRGDAGAQVLDRGQVLGAAQQGGAHPSHSLDRLCREPWW